MSENKHSKDDLRQMQSLPIETKIHMTQRRIRDWVDYWNGDVYVSFSGGKDSTVLKHIVDGMYDDIPSVFVNTGLEYPEIQAFVQEVKAGKYDCFNSNVEIIRPEMRFDEVIREYGYPVVSKAVAHSVDIAKRNPEGSVAKNVFSPEKTGRFAFSRWAYLIDAPFHISDKCCNIMKKKPSEKYARETGRKVILATMAEESSLRYSSWLKHGCNAFEGDTPKSQPMSFWTEQDVLHYIKRFNVPYCQVYGDIQLKRNADTIDNQINLIDLMEDYKPDDILETTKRDRTGCMFCMFGCHLEKEPNRFQRDKLTHPKQIEFMLNGGQYVDGVWKPSKDGLGMRKVLDYIGVPYE